jgi:sugar phosphate isomerase/epimerase
MKFAVSNIALTAYDHEEELDQLAGLGLSGLEVAPSRVWRDTWDGLEAAQVEAYRRQVEDAGLTVVGLHSLFYDHSDLGLFREPKDRARTLDFMEHLSAVCRDLGGKTLVYGGGRKRGDVPQEDAIRETVTFMGELAPRIEDHGTCFCFEPLSPDDTDFIHSAFESLDIVKAVDHPCLKVQLDAKALIANDEATPETFKAVRDDLVHVHANEPDLGVLGSSGVVDHAALGRMLKDIGYDGYVSIEQRMIDATDPMAGIRQSTIILKACYA